MAQNSLLFDAQSMSYFFSFLTYTNKNLLKFTSVLRGNGSIDYQKWLKLSCYIFLAFHVLKSLLIFRSILWESWSMDDPKWQNSVFSSPYQFFGELRCCTDSFQLIISQICPPVKINRSNLSFRYINQIFHSVFFLNFYYYYMKRYISLTKYGLGPNLVKPLYYMLIGWPIKIWYFYHTTCESTCDTLSSSAANQDDNTVSVAQGSTATPGATKYLKEIYIYIYIYIYIFLCKKEYSSHWCRSEILIDWHIISCRKIEIDLWFIRQLEFLFSRKSL